MKKLLKVLLYIFLGIVTVFGALTTVNFVNSIVMYKYVDSFSPVEKEGALTPEYDEDGVPYFVTDGDFKVLHLTDVHIGGGVLSAGNDRKAINAVAAMVTAEKPDLVVVTGDVSFAIPTTGTLNNSYAHSYFIRLMERLGVYWTVTFGNHDSEKYNYYGRQDVASMYGDESLEYCLFSSGPSDVYGECNHVINVRNSLGLITRSLVMIDTNSYTEDDPIGLGWDYDTIRESQIEWYSDTIGKYTAYNNDILSSLPEESVPSDTSAFTTVKSMMFMHIPIREVRDAYNEYVNNNRQNTENTTFIGGNDGETGKVVYCPEDDEEMFETVLALGSTEALFYGHDHLNNFVLVYKGVTFSYGYSIDYLAYFGIDGKGYQRGCTVLTLSPDGRFTITHENYYQDKYPSLYDKEEVDLSK